MTTINQHIKFLDERLDEGEITKDHLKKISPKRKEAIQFPTAIVLIGLIGISFYGCSNQETKPEKDVSTKAVPTQTETMGMSIAEEFLDIEEKILSVAESGELILDIDSNISSNGVIKITGKTNAENLEFILNSKSKIFPPEWTSDNFRYTLDKIKPEKVSDWADESSYMHILNKDSGNYSDIEINENKFLIGGNLFWYERPDYIDSGASLEYEILDYQHDTLKRDKALTLHIKYKNNKKISNLKTPSFCLSHNFEIICSKIISVPVSIIESKNLSYYNFYTENYVEATHLYTPDFYQNIFNRLSTEYENWVQVYNEFGPPEENIKGTMFVLGFDENGNPHNKIIYGDVAARIDEIRKEIPSPSPELNLSGAELDLYLELYAYSSDLSNLLLYSHEKQDIRLRKQQKVIQNLLREYNNAF